MNANIKKNEINKSLIKEARLRQSTNEMITASSYSKFL